LFLSRHRAPIVAGIWVADRVVIRRGRSIDTTPPDYRQLDDLMTPEFVR
jgi:hypothetical protein